MKYGKLLWKKVLFRLQDFFGVSPKEARGAFFLLLASFTSLIFPVIFRQVLLPLLPDRDEAWRQHVLDSLVRELAAESDGRKTAKSITDSTSRPGPFDPNTAPPAALEAVGIPPFLARRIVAFRNKGGRFRKKEDLRRIYDFPDTLYRSLAPFIVLPEGKAAQAAVTHPAKPGLPGSASLRTGRPAGKNFREQAPVAPFDINQADTAMLRRLRGIGQVRAQRIVAFRDALGGFYKPEQFTEIYGMDSLSLAELQRYARILSPVQKIRINTVSEEIFQAHPYARKNRRQAKAILLYREQHGSFRTRADLEKIRNLDPVFLEIILPYLSFE